jgi:hypothetical protein
MLRLDLDLAGVPYVIEGPDGPLFADFHALRDSYIALLDKSGATLKEAMQLARHSDPKLTMAVYGRAQLHDLGAAVGRLPSLLNEPDTETQALQATGTDGPADPAAGDPLTGAYRILTSAPDAGCPPLRLVDGREGEGSGKKNRPQPQTLQGVDGGCERVMSVDASSPRVPRNAPRSPAWLPA